MILHVRYQISFDGLQCSVVSLSGFVHHLMGTGLHCAPLNFDAIWHRNGVPEFLSFIQMEAAEFFSRSWRGLVFFTMVKGGTGKNFGWLVINRRSPLLVKYDASLKEWHTLSQDGSFEQGHGVALYLESWCKSGAIHKLCNTEGGRVVQSSEKLEGNVHVMGAIGVWLNKPAYLFLSGVHYLVRLEHLHKVKAQNLQREMFM